MPYTVYLRHERYLAGKPHTDAATLEVEAPSTILAAEKAERFAQARFGGELEAWFAYRVEPDTSIEEICG